MKKKTPPPAKPVKALKPKKIHTVWEARLYVHVSGYTMIGYLVTPTGDPNKPTAIVYCEDSLDEEAARATAFSVALEPWLTSVPMFHGIDLRDRELPTWLWALHVAPIDIEGEVDDDDAEQHLEPFCPIRFYKMVAAFVEQKFPEADRKKFPFIAIDIENDDCACQTVRLERPGQEARVP